MGNTVTCFERWGKRHPDGALLTLPTGKSKQSGLLASISSASTKSSSSDTTSASSRSASSIKAQNGGGETKGATEKTSRQSRRRPTYSATKKKSDTEASSFDYDDEDDDESTDQELSAKDVRAKKIAGYRRSLTKVVKFWTKMGKVNVKATISKDGMNIEWYKGKSSDANAEQQQGKRKPCGSFPVDKISVMKAKPGDSNAIEFAVNKPTGFETYTFSCKSREEREAWQQELESFRKFISLK